MIPRLIDHTDSYTVWMCAGRTIRTDRRTPSKFYVWNNGDHIGTAATLEAAAALCTQ